MRFTKGWVFALALAVVGVHAQTSEPEARRAIEAEMQDAFAKGNFKALEDRYVAALAQSTRTPSGVFVADLIQRTVVTDSGAGSADPGHDSYWIPIEGNLDRWAAQYPNSSLVAVVQSSAYINHAFAWRGGGFARTVSPEGASKAALYAQRAHDALMAREKVGRKDPYWYAQMIAVSRIQSWPQESSLALMQEATSAFPSNYAIYSAIALRMTPRWGGSQEALAKLASFAVDQTRKLEGESMYARIYWNVGDWLDADLSGPDVDWQRIRAGFDDIVKRHPDNWNLNFYARFACDARDLPTARKVLLRIKGNVATAAWRERANYLRCVQAAGLKREELQ